MPVSGVAPLVGYRTTSAYVAAFRAHTGVTPGRYFDPAPAASGADDRGRARSARHVCFGRSP
jgi:AraC-like DNA-binding protein